MIDASGGEDCAESHGLKRFSADFMAFEPIFAMFCHVYLIFMQFSGCSVSRSKLCSDADCSCWIWLSFSRAAGNAMAPRRSNLQLRTPRNASKRTVFRPDIERFPHFPSPFRVPFGSSHSFTWSATWGAPRSSPSASSCCGSCRGSPPPTAGPWPRGSPGPPRVRPPPPRPWPPASPA